MISVIMTIYKEPWRWVHQAVCSLARQSYKNFEVIIIVDNPGYPSIAELQSLLKHLKLTAVIRVNDDNLGLVASLNSALNLVSGQYIARFDSDDECLPDRFDKELRFLRDNNYDFVSSSINLMSENGDIIKSLAFKGSLSTKQVKWIEPRSNPFWHPTWLMRKKVMDELKGYRSLYSVEDFDFVLRALDAKFELGILGEALVNKRIVESSISETGGYRQAVYAHFLINKYRSGELNLQVKLPKINPESEREYLSTLARKKKLERASALKKIGFSISLLSTSSGRLILANIIHQRFSIPAVKIFKCLIF